MLKQKLGKIIFILGGARSGKSAYALELAKKYKKVAFIATGEPKDLEMQRRISAHKKNRPRHWQTLEEPKNIGLPLKIIKNNYDCLVIDCLTLWVSNLILAGYSQSSIEGKVNKILLSLKRSKATAIIVSNEVGLGIVPLNQLSRRFRDIAGKINQIVAKEADTVIFMVSGLPAKIK